MSQTCEKPTIPPDPMQKLKAERVELLLARLPGWQASPDQTLLSRELALANPRAAARFAEQACDWAARRQGEAWFSVSHRRFQVRLWTPAVGGLTEADFTFAKKLDLWLELMEEEGLSGEAAG